MAKASVAKATLEKIALVEIQAHRGCRAVTAVEIEHEDFWKVEIMRDKPQQDADRCDMTEAIADRLRSQFDLKA